MNKIKFNENNFIFWTDGGLGNRLLGLGSAYELAVRSGYTADVIWDLNPHCMAKFEDLFRVNNSDKIRIHNLWDWRKKNLFGTLYGDMTREKLRKISDEYLSSEKSFEIFHEEKWSELIEKVKKQKMFIKSFSQIMPFSKETFQMIKPSDKVLEKGGDILRQINRDYCGVHIRRTDHQSAILQSPTSLFIEYMYNELKNNPDVKFFLTTDDEKERNRIIEEFGSDKILYISNTELKRDSVNGMQHAFADMYGLSLCGKILESAESTFGYVASLIGACELIYIKK